MDNRTNDSGPAVLTIAGLDPSGGAGLVADIRAFTAFGCFPTAVLTSITFQNRLRVFGAMHQTAATVRAQVEPILLDLNVVAAKTGMLPTGEIVSEVARLFRETKLPAPVVDPVMVSTSGFDLIADDAFLRLKSELLVLSRVVTPNIPEAERLTGLRITNTTDMWHAAQAIRELGVRAVLIKGGHLREQNEAVSREAIDILDDGGEVTVFRGEWIYAAEVHGTGCTLSAAIAACLGRGMELKASVSAAKKYVTENIRRQHY